MPGINKFFAMYELFAMYHEWQEDMAKEISGRQSQEYLEKVAKTVSFLAQPEGSFLLLLTGEVQKDRALELLSNLKDLKTKFLPSTTRGGKELPSSSALDSPSVMSKFATSPPARNLDLPPMLDDACDTTAIDAMPDTARNAMLDTALPDDARDAIMLDDAILDTARDTPLPDVPLGAFLDTHIARVTANARDTSDTADAIEIEPAFAPIRPSSPRYELRDIPDVEQVLKAQNDLLNELNDNSVRVITREGKMTQEPLYPEGHPERIDQDSQGINADSPSHPKEKKKDDRSLHASSPNTITPEEPNDISASDAETQSGDEHERGENVDSDVHNNAQHSHDEDVEIEPMVNPDNPQPKRYDKNDFTARKHGKEREPWVQRPMPFPSKPSKKKDDEDFKRFVEMIRPVF
ncbi:hypothetical protein ZWY2020_014613 [Hordeum vulgare]|nr:hypothetical protein ZWY2020_014613 [Hordeum vulgare]